MSDPFRNYDAWLEAPIQRMYAEAESWCAAFDQWCEDNDIDAEAAVDDPEVVARFEAWLAEQERDAAEDEAERRYEDAQEPVDYDPPGV